MSSETIAIFFATYRKYGWIPRRLILTERWKDNVANPEPEVPVYDGDVDAAWFSRPPSNGEIACEIRHLGSTPYALLENLDETSPDFDERLKAVEAMLRAAVMSKGH